MGSKIGTGAFVKIKLGFIPPKINPFFQNSSIPLFQSIPIERHQNKVWQARRDLNPQHPDLESDALPLELLACIQIYDLDTFGYLG